MQAHQVIKYIKQPALLTQEDVPDLQKLVQDFPYFQAAHLLLSIAAKKWDTSVYQQSLKKTAITSVNRAHLFFLLHREEEIEAEVAQVPESKLPATQEVALKEELQILKAAELSVDESEKHIQMAPPIDSLVDIEKEIEKQVVVSFVEKELIKTPEWQSPPLKTETPESFGDWLSYLKKNNGKESYGEIEAQVNEDKTRKAKVKKEKDAADSDALVSRKQRNKAIMDKVIEKNPGLIRVKEEPKFFIPEQKAKESLLENEHLITETLARIYALQGNVNKAVRAYEILSLKFPQKSAYFATLIQKLKNNQ
jgi:hypothetical protein